jgi:biofilm protein TabA
MIFDNIRNIELYSHLSKSLRDSFDFFQNNKFSFQKNQTLKIDTKGMYAILQKYSPKDKADLLIESHRKFIDLQVMVEGKEYLGYAEKNTLCSMGYDENHDTERLTGTLTFFPFYQGFFVVLFPQDAHMPGVKHHGSTKVVKKIVIKIPIELW